MYGQQDQLRVQAADAYEALVAPELSDYVSPLLERLCQRMLPRLIDRQFQEFGQWWFKEHELDVLGLSEEGLVAGECKFTTNLVSEGVLNNLERTISNVRWSAGPADGEPLYVLFSRSGYTDDLKQIAGTREDVRLFDLAKVISPSLHTENHYKPEV